MYITMRFNLEGWQFVAGDKKLRRGSERLVGGFIQEAAR